MAGALTIDTLNNSAGVFAANNAFKGIAKAWVNFDGKTASGNTIRSSLNVSSIVRNAAGNYTVNFATPMSDTNYACVTNTFGSTFADWGAGILTPGSDPTTTSINLLARGSATGTYYDAPYVCLAVFD